MRTHQTEMINYQAAMLVKIAEGERLVREQSRRTRPYSAILLSALGRFAQWLGAKPQDRQHLHAALKDASAEQASHLFRVCLSDAQQGAGQPPAKEIQMLRQLLAAEHLLAQLIDEAPACSQSAPPSGES